jgi:hypothetical protein
MANHGNDEGTSVLPPRYFPAFAIGELSRRRLEEWAEPADRGSSGCLVIRGLICAKSVLCGEPVAGRKDKIHVSDPDLQVRRM